MIHFLFICCGIVIRLSRAICYTMITSNALLAALVGCTAWVAAHAGHDHGEKYQQKKFVGETKEDREYIYGPDCPHPGATI